MIDDKKSLPLIVATADNTKPHFPDLSPMTGEQRLGYGGGMLDHKITITPAAPGNFNGVMEFGRARDVQAISGIKRGMLHLLVAEGKIRSVLIRRRGNVHGTRYYYIPSVLAYMHSLMAEQNGGARE